MECQDRELTTLGCVAAQLYPALRAAHGVGPDTAAQLILTAGTNPDRLRSEAAFAALCGAAPVPASSGKTSGHRLSCGVTRAYGAAPLAPVRMRSHQPTRDYVARQIVNGRTQKEILRLRKRASPACSNCSPGPACSSTTATYVSPGKPKTSPSPPSPPLRRRFFISECRGRAYVPVESLTTHCSLRAVIK